MSGRVRGGRGGGRDSGKGPHNVNELNAQKSGGNDEGQHGGQGQGQGHVARHAIDKGGRNSKTFGRGAYH